MSNFRQVTPFLHVPDLETAIRFFTDILGFEIYIQARDYAYLHRETVGVRILESPRDGPDPDIQMRRYGFYIDVHDVDALYLELKPKLDTLPPEEVAGPLNQPWGQRELLVVGPDRNWLAFGHAIAGRQVVSGGDSGHDEL